MQAYSTPITPPPTTIIVLGMSGICRIWSLLRMLRPLMGTFGETAGFVPVAITMVPALYTLAPREPSTRIVCGSTKLAHPNSISMLLRISCDSVTSISVLITCCTRKTRSAMQIFSFTR